MTIPTKNDTIDSLVEGTDFLCQNAPLVCEKDTVLSTNRRTRGFLLELTMRSKRITKICKWCGKTFTIVAGRGKIRGSGQYCSVYCRTKGIQKKTKDYVLSYIGKKFNRLTILSYLGKNQHGHHVVKCQCDCGNITKQNLYFVIHSIVYSCGCYKKEQWLQYIRLPRGKANFNKLYDGYKRGAKTRKLCFSLSKGEFYKLTQDNCFYCGQSPKQKMNDKTAYGEFIYNGIDRKDPKVGYEIDNCVTACKQCNFAKQTLTMRGFLELVRKIYLHNKKGGNHGTMFKMWKSRRRV